MVGNADVCFYGSTSTATLAETTVRPDPTGGPVAGAKAMVAERPKHISDASVLTLDGYGTLVDRESGIIAALMPWLRDVGVTAGHSEVIRAFGQAERANLLPGIVYRDVLVRVHEQLAEFFGVDPDQKAAREFAASIGQWPVHPEVPEALAYLKQHFQLVVLTNVDHASFDATNEALGVEFDAVYTAEDTGIYKPNSGMFAYLLSRLDEAGIERQGVLHVAGSIRFDHVPAKRLGMDTCWIHRKRDPERLTEAHKRGLDIHPDYRFQTLGKLAEAHLQEICTG